MSYSIEQATESDREHILGFWWSLQSQGLLPFGGPSEDWWFHCSDSLGQLIASSRAVVLVARLGDEPVGTLSGHVYEKPGVEKSLVAVFYSLWVEPEHRGQGLATRLLQILTERLQAMGAQTAQVGWGASDDCASSWWQSKGFAPYEVIASRSMEP